MTMFALDTEFNEQDGELISIALVHENGDSLYLEVPFDGPWKSWVAIHVKPKLTGPKVSWLGAQHAVGLFLDKYAYDATVEVVADWPADFLHLCNLLDLGGGKRTGPRNITMRLIGGLDCKPINPHHALSDAEALMRVLKGEE